MEDGEAVEFGPPGAGDGQIAPPRGGQVARRGGGVGCRGGTDAGIAVEKGCALGEGQGVSRMSPKTVPGTPGRTCSMRWRQARTMRKRWRTIWS